jgi:hypothetical protein
VGGVVSQWWVTVTETLGNPGMLKVRFIKEGKDTTAEH